MQIPNDRRTGIYWIKNWISGLVYIGSAAQSFKDRCHGHRKLLRHGKHYNKHLQRAWDKYGADAFVFEVLEVCEPADCLTKEQVWLDRLPKEAKYNNALFAASPTKGMEVSAETRKKLSTANKGRTYSEETKAAMSLAAKQSYENGERAAREKPTKTAGQKKRWAKPEQRKKRSEAYKEMYATEEGFAQLKAMAQKAGEVLRGKVRPPEELANISAGTKTAMAELRANDPEFENRRKAAHAVYFENRRKKEQETRDRLFGVEKNLFT